MTVATSDEIMSESDARRLTEKIRITAHTYAEAREKLIRYVDEAKSGNAHLALGYASWTAYLSDVLGEEPMRLAADDRREVVQLLSNEGMSTRAIAPIVGADQKTISNDLRRAEELSSPASAESAPSPDESDREEVTGMDGKKYPKKKRKSPTKVTDEMVAEMVERYEAGESAESIASGLSMTSSAVRDRLRREGVAMRTASEKLTRQGRQSLRSASRSRVLDDHAKMFSELSNRFVGMAMGLSRTQEINETLTPEMAREIRGGWDEAYKEIKRLRGLVIERSKETW